MSSDTEFLRIIKQAALDAVHVTSPMSMCFGSVESTDPLKVRINQKLLLTKESLFLSDNVSDYTELLEIDGEVKEVKHLNKLQQGEQVLLVRMDGGRMYYVANRARS